LPQWQVEIIKNLPLPMDEKKKKNILKDGFQVIILEGEGLYIVI
jgi:hypothetical protein